MVEETWNVPSTMPTGKKCRVRTVSGMKRIAITYQCIIDARGNRRVVSRDRSNSSDLTITGWLPLEGETA